MKVKNIIFMMGLLIGLIGLTTNPLLGQISVCNNDANFSATATSASGASDMDYILVQPDGTTIEASNATGTFTVPTIVGAYTLYAVNHDGTANLTVVPPTGDCLEFVTQTVTVADAPDLTVMASIANTCPTTTADLTTAVTDADGGTVAYFESDGTTTVATPTAVSAGTYVITSTSGTCSDSETVTVSITAPCPLSVCENESVTATATATGGATDLDYMLVCGGVVTSTNTTGTFDLAALGVTPGTCDLYVVNHDGTADLSVAPPTGSCLEYATRVLTVLDAPDLMVTAAIMNACPATTADLTSAVTDADGGTVAYFESDGTTTVATPTAVAAGTYVITSTIGTCSDSETVTVTIDPCAPTSISACENESVTATATATGGATDLDYMLVCGGVVTSTNTTGTFDLEALGVTPGTCDLYVVNHDGTADLSVAPPTGSCLEYATLVLTVLDAPDLMVTAAIMNACPATTADLTTAVTDADGGTVAYFESDGITSVGTPTAVAAGTYVITSTSGTCSDSETVTVTIDPCAPAGVSACENESVTVTATATGGATNLDYMLVCGGVVTSTNATGTFDLEALGVSPGTCDLYAVNHDGTADLSVAPPTGTCIEFVSQTLTVLDAPDLTVMAAITNSCPATTADLTTAVTSTGGGTVSYFESDGMTAVGDETAVAAGTYVISSTDGTCTETATVTVSVTSCADITICDSETLNVSATAASGASDLDYVLICGGAVTASNATGAFDLEALGVIGGTTCTVYAVNHDGTANLTTDPPSGTCIEMASQTVTVEDCCGPANVVLAPSGTTAVPSLCDDGAWTYYYNPANPSDVLFAIEWAPDGTLDNVAEKAGAGVTITKDPTYNTSPTAGTGEITWTMERYWNVTINGVHGTTLTEPVNVKFFYDMPEYNAIITAANAAATAMNPYEGVRWFKTTGKVFDPPVDNNTGPTVNGGAIELTDMNTGGLTENGVLYAQFNGVTSFSGGTATTGIGPSSTPLPVELLSFKGEAEGDGNRLDWITSSEMNSSHFEIERSKDGLEFDYMGKVNAQGESSIPVSYRFMDEDPFSVSYYRLRMVDLDGTYEYSNTVTIKRDLGKSLFISNIKPVPTTDQATVEFVSHTKGEIKFRVTDINGRLLDEIAIEVNEGDNEYSYDFSSYIPGMYVITIGNEYSRDVKRMIKN